MVKLRYFRALLIWCLGISVIPAGHSAEPPLADATIVIYNKAVPESGALAKFYAQQRNIAKDHVIGLDCSTEEEISRDDYEATIAQPLREIFKTRHWWVL